MIKKANFHFGILADLSSKNFLTKTNNSYEANRISLKKKDLNAICAASSWLKFGAPMARIEDKSRGLRIRSKNRRGSSSECVLQTLTDET